MHGFLYGGENLNGLSRFFCNPLCGLPALMRKALEINMSITNINLGLLANTNLGLFYNILVLMDEPRLRRP